MLRPSKAGTKHFKEEYMKRIIFFFLFLLLKSHVKADALNEYNNLLEHLRNYNTLGFFIINNADSWQRNPIIKTDLDNICLVPYDKGFFQFLDIMTGRLVYSRNAMLSVDIMGIVCIDYRYQLFPIIKIDKSLSYKLRYENKKLIVEYPDESIIEEYDIFLYWPKEINDSDLFGEYFYFDNVYILHDDRIMSGYICTSSVNIQMTLVKMMKLVSEIRENNNSIIYGTGNVETTLAILQSLLTASYTVEIEPPVYYLKSEERERRVISGHGLPFEIIIESPVRMLRVDPLGIGFLYDFLKITSP